MIDLKAFRKSIKISQKELAIQIGTDQSLISKYENGFESDHLELLLLEKFPNAKKFKLEGKKKTSEELEKELDEALKKLDSYEEKMEHLDERLSGLIRSNEALTRIIEKMEDAKKQNQS